jgi:hypothetical protein
MPVAATPKAIIIAASALQMSVTSSIAANICISKKRF